MVQRIGIHGIGTYLPETVRTNDWWPPEIVEGWATHQVDRERQGPKPDLTPAQAKLMERVVAMSADPFRGAVERRVLDDSLGSSDMEVFAAQDLFSRVNFDPQQIDLVLTSSMIPDYLVSNNACTLHERMGLQRNCFTLQVESVCNAFQQQMILAEAMIAQGRANWALLVQSNLSARLCPPEVPHSAWFGDGATALLVGPVSEERGLLGWVQRTNGALQDTLTATKPGGNWWDTGEIQYLLTGRGRARTMLMNLPDYSRECIHAALDQAGLSTEDVDFYASHQGTCWLREVTQEQAGLGHAKTIDLFPRFASLSGANLPMVLFEGERDDALRPGDVVVTYAGGSGITWGASVIRWGV